MVTQNPNIMSKAAMTAMSSTSGSGDILLSEILTKVNNAKDKPKKKAVLQQYDTPGLRMILKGAFDPNIVWDLPTGTPPYIANEAPKGTEHSLLKNESKRLWHFVQGADNDTTKTQKETMFIQMLEGLHQEEAELLIGVKDKTLNKMYKGLTAALVKEAYDWNDNFMQNENK
jgi:hypothetical protein